MDVDNKKVTELPIDIGGLLVEARENLGLSGQDVATQMNLAFDIIDKIEENDFELDIPIAFVRGYIKSYATKVGLDTGPMLQQFDKTVGVESPSLKRVQSISRFDKKRDEINSSHYLFKAVSILILLTFLSFAGWELWNRFGFTVQESLDSQELTNSDISAQLSTAEDNQIAADGVVDDTAEVSNDDNYELATEANQNKSGSQSVSDIDIENSAPGLEQYSATDQSVQQEIVDTSGLIMTSLILDFSADCWVKIVDARGEVIALGVKQSGKHMPVEGVAPFNVILGDPSVVTMSYAGLDYDLSSYRAGRRAEIVLN